MTTTLPTPPDPTTDPAIRHICDTQTKVRPALDITFINDVCAALREAGRDELAGLLANSAGNCIRSQEENRYLDAARERYQDSDLEYDDDAVVSLSESGGAFVMAWRYIGREEAGFEEDDGDRDDADTPAA